MAKERSDVITVVYGVDSRSVKIKPGLKVANLILDTELADELGFNPWNVNAIINGHVLRMDTKLVPGQTVVLETAANTKGVGTPKEHKCEKWRRKNGYVKEPGKGDHWRWLIGQRRVTVNYRNGHMDFASLKAIAHLLNRSVADLAQDIQST
jgi:hypothetical protein